MEDLAAYWDPSSKTHPETGPRTAVSDSLRQAFTARDTAHDILQPLSCEGRVAINKRAKVDGAPPPQLDVNLTFPHLSGRLGSDQ